MTKGPVITWGRLRYKLKALLRPAVREWKWLLPPWLSDLHLGSADDSPHDADGVLALTDFSLVSYRQVRVLFSSRLLNENTVMISKTVLHEFCHVVLAPIHVIINNCTLADPLPVLIDESFENSVEDMTNRIWKKITSYKKIPPIKRTRRVL